MEYRVLGRTGLNVSVAGMGCGGPSRLGMRHGATEEEAAEVVRAALDAGINFLDTAEAYGTEGAVGKAIRGVARDSVVISTKIPAVDRNGPVRAADFEARLDACLSRLGTDYVDILHLHGVVSDEYDHAVNELVPTMQRLQEAGKLRFLGITEAFGPDPSHQMMHRALSDGYWDVVMVGFNILNQSARQTVLPTTRNHDIGVLCMFAVRRALADPDKLRGIIEELIERGEVDAENFDRKDPLGFLTVQGAAQTIPDAAYRFCREEPGIHVVLTGTGNKDHLHENIASLNASPLPDAITQQLQEMFAGVDSVSGN
ncbi:MAG: aldo/keto reductase [Armatimonadaceae bacterium]